MTETNECRLCKIWNGCYENLFDRPYLINDDFLSIVSIGAFINGWSLIIPKNHTYSMRSYYSRKSLYDFIAIVAKKLSSQYNSKLIAFEHGANRCDSLTSCGTHHAHLHLLPYNHSILEEMHSDRSWIKTSFSEVSNLVGSEEYLLYSELQDPIADSDVYIHLVENAESQYFRKLLAKKEGITDYSYKSSPFIASSINSYNQLKEM
jgi:diadenosine tetraphosphate (Ap4A) HIT family hydrolase